MSGKVLSRLFMFMTVRILSTSEPEKLKRFFGVLFSYIFPVDYYEANVAIMPFLRFWGKKVDRVLGFIPP